MHYLIYGNENYFIKQSLKEIKQKYASYEPVIFVYDDFFEHEKLIQSFENNLLFSEEKIIIIYNCFYLEKAIAKAENSKAKELANLIKNTAHIVVFINEKIEQRKNIADNTFTREIKLNDATKFTIFEAQNIKGIQLDRAINEIVKHKGATIDASASSLLITKIGSNLELIEQEIDKLIYYNKTITYDAVQNLVMDMVEDNAFAFVNSFENYDFSNIWRKYKAKVHDGVAIAVLIMQISQLFIIAKQIHDFKEANISIDKYAATMKINFYRAQKINNILQIYGIKRVNEIIKALAQLDMDYKNGKVDEKVGFERFLIKFFL
ncbi:DNA polymerase III subunit delta [Mycoplasmopsis opalescens]|uniref:DNA polymerase III subunit delta n=1 Tax=Mycoplasmopsis opalescens TaxID=114886 RepID=UPI0004A6AA97|nr:DNA polymerase III subunit delta [Mycoplasmopsis opalescens]